MTLSLATKSRFFCEKTLMITHFWAADVSNKFHFGNILENVKALILQHFASNFTLDSNVNASVISPGLQGCATACIQSL